MNGDQEQLPVGTPIYGAPPSPSAPPRGVSDWPGASREAGADLEERAGTLVFLSYCMFVVCALALFAGMWMGIAEGSEFKAYAEFAGGAFVLGWMVNVTGQLVFIRAKR